MMPQASDVPGVLQGQRQRNRPSDQVRYDIDDMIRSGASWYPFLNALQYR